MSAVWGIDPSTKQIAVAVHSSSRVEWTGTKAISQESSKQLRLARAAADLSAWFKQIVQERGAPRLVVLEQPFAAGRKVHPQSQYMLGAVQIALCWGVSAHVDVRMLGPSQWKSLAWGNGAAGKEELMRRALAEYGRAMMLSQDEADAIGIAVAATMLV